MKELIARVHNLFRPANSWKIGYNDGYHKGLREGQDFGERVAHNRTLVKELPKILSRYSQLQAKIINLPKAQMRKEIINFEEREVDKLKMELQNR